MELLGFIVGIAVLLAMGWGCWESSVMLSERNYLRKITGQYYDFDIDDKLKEMGITRAEALKDKDLFL
jgi:hypothetical protein|tara:strand:+ start:1079 stop:1282 length:204 start_codon:yes stop_codon:yes gene_type:complete